jgi:hypothetical protein
MDSTSNNLGGYQVDQSPKRKPLNGPLTRKSPERRAAHVAKMARKKILRSIPDTGFLPIGNHRINSSIDTVQALLLLQNSLMVKQGLANPLDPNTARETAIREVASKLEPARRVFDWRNGQPTKNNNPEYRGQHGNGPRRLAAMGATA